MVLNLVQTNKRRAQLIYCVPEIFAGKMTPIIYYGARKYPATAAIEDVYFPVKGSWTTLVIFCYLC